MTAFGPALVAVLALLTVAGAAVVRWGGLGDGRAVLIAAVRAVTQLALVSLVITAILRSFPLTGLFVLLMFGIAAVTSARRAGGWANLPWTAPPGWCLSWRWFSSPESSRSRAS